MSRSLSHANQVEIRAKPTAKNSKYSLSVITKIIKAKLVNNSAIKLAFIREKYHSLASKSKGSNETFSTIFEHCDYTSYEVLL